MNIPRSHRAYEADEDRNHRRDEQHDAAGWLPDDDTACAICGGTDTEEESGECCVCGATTRVHISLRWPV